MKAEQLRMKLDIGWDLDTFGEMVDVQLMIFVTTPLRQALLIMDVPLERIVVPQHQMPG